MRQWIPLDVRNVDNPVALRNQLRRLNEYMNDLAASLASPNLVPQQPDSLTIFNNFLQQIAIAGGDPLNLAFLDDFVFEPPGVWVAAGSGAGSNVAIDLGNTDHTAIGSWKFTTAPVVGGAHEVISPSGNVNFPLTLAPGIRIGARVRLDVIDFTRGLFSVGFTDANTSGSNSQQGTERGAFVLWHTDADYFTAGSLFQNEALFEAAHDPGGGVQYSSVRFGSATDFMRSDFTNIELRVTAEQTIDCRVNGASVGILSGNSVPDSTHKLALRIRAQTNGNTNPGPNQLSYIDRIYIDARDVNRGKT